MHILICGAGIAGLTLGQVCRKLGHNFEILEAAPTLRLEGAGIQLSPNAMRVMQALGLDEKILQVGHIPVQGEIVSGPARQRLMSFPLGRMAEQQFGAPYVQIQRGKLVNILSEGLDIHFNQKARTLSQISGHSGYKVHLTTESGTQKTADICVGADGIHSAIRASVVGPSTPRFTGYQAWRAQVDVSELSCTPSENASVHIGQTGHVVTYRMGRDRLNFVGILKASNPLEEGWGIDGDVQEALSLFEAFGPEVVEIIKASPSLNVWGLYDRAPLSAFHQGRVALMGDAAHPILPFLAQGGAMAIEDAWALGQCLSFKEKGLEAYSHLRAERVRRVQAASKNQAHIYHTENPIKRWGVKTAFRTSNRLVPSAGLRRLSWVYGYDIIRETEKSISALK